MVTQDLGDRQDQVGGGRPLRELAGELHTYHLRRQHVDGLAKHRRLRLDSSYPPAEDAKAIDHRRVGICTDNTVRQRYRGVTAMLQRHDAGEILQVHLVDDSRGGRNNPEIIESISTPAQELVALTVALEFALGVDQEGGQRAVFINLYRMVDDQVNRNQRVDLLRVSTQPGGGASQRREVDHGRHTGKVLHDHPCGLEGNLAAAGIAAAPGCEAQHILLAHLEPIALAQGGLQQNLDRVGKTRDRSGPLRLKTCQAEPVHLSRGGFQLREGTEGIIQIRHFHYP